MNSASENVMRTRLLMVFSLIGLMAVSFYLVQNNGLLSGGAIALPKIIWLAYAILCWFCLPLLFILDSRIDPVWKSVYRIFLINMLARAVVELFMMYVMNNWSPYYGIAHDIFSILLLAMLMIVYRHTLPRDIFFAYSLMLILMFLIEICFVIYMIVEVVGNDAIVYFVPGGDAHAGILNITWFVVALLTRYILMFTRRWGCGEFVRASR